MEENELIEIIAGALECDASSIDMESGLGNHYNWDSFGHLSIMVLLEQDYNIEISEENILKLVTVKEILLYLNACEKVN